MRKRIDRIECVVFDIGEVNTKTGKDLQGYSASQSNIDINLMFINSKYAALSNLLRRANTFEYCLKKVV